MSGISQTEMCFVSIISQEARGQKVFPMDFSLFHLPGSERHKPPSALLPLVLKVRQYLTSTDHPSTSKIHHTHTVHGPKEEIHPNVFVPLKETRIIINHNMKKCQSGTLLTSLTLDHD